MLRLFRNTLLMEVLIATLVIGIVAALLLSRLAHYQEMAEKAHMEMTVATVKSALRMRLASMMIEGRAHEYSGLAEQNPMEWLEQKPANYAGELTRSGSTADLQGNWYFDRSARSLVYFVKHGSNFKASSNGEKSISIGIILTYEPQVNDDKAGMLVTGARLQHRHAYEWL